jgi:hypothetical protein
VLPIFLSPADWTYDRIIGSSWHATAFLSLSLQDGVSMMRTERAMLFIISNILRQYFM